MIEMSLPHVQKLSAVLPDLPVKPHLGRNRTGYVGVNKNGSRFIAQISVNGHRQTIGTYDTAEEAALSWDEAALRLRGDNPLINFPEREVPHDKPAELRAAFDALNEEVRRLRHENDTLRAEQKELHALREERRDWLRAHNYVTQQKVTR